MRSLTTTKMGLPVYKLEYPNGTTSQFTAYAPICVAMFNYGYELCHKDGRKGKPTDLVNLTQKWQRAGCPYLNTAIQLRVEALGLNYWKVYDTVYALWDEGMSKIQMYNLLDYPTDLIAALVLDMEKVQAFFYKNFK